MASKPLTHHEVVAEVRNTIATGESRLALGDAALAVDHAVAAIRRSPKAMALLSPVNEDDRLYEQLYPTAQAAPTSEEVEQDRLLATLFGGAH